MNVVSVINRNKREFLYTLLLFVVFELFVDRGVGLLSRKLLLVDVIVGGIVLFSWIIFNYLEYGVKKISDLSDTHIKIKAFQRIVYNFAYPIILYVMTILLLHIFYLSLLQQWLIIISTILFFLLFVNIRQSYKHIFSLSANMKVVFDVFSLLLFVASLIVIRESFPSFPAFVVGTSFFATAILGNLLYVNNQFNFKAILFILLFIITLILVTFFLYPSGIIVVVINAIILYLAITLFHIRMLGSYKISDFLLPFIFACMLVLLILNS